MKRLKNVLFSLAAIWLVMPATVFAINPFYVHKNQSIGEIFREVIFQSLFGLYIIFYTILILFIPAIIAGYFIHRRYLTYLFFVLYPLFFLFSISLNGNKKLSNILLGNITWFYSAVLLTIISFFASTLFNKIKKRKHPYSRKDYIPLFLIILITIFLIFLPIRSGHLVCKTPLLNKAFNCDYYLQEDKEFKRSWFIF